jgi:threonylcarbamoyladenosine tRNA methylthiotransferase MtaB
VSLVIGNEEKQKLLDYLMEDHEGTAIAVSDIRQVEKVCLPPLTTFSGRSRAFVQIQNGCDAFCSYCIIPYARGASRSAAPDEILQQVNGLVVAGYNEVVLTGIHIGGYGADLTPPISLNALVRRIEAETGIRRLRLGSIEPTELTDELLETIASSHVICPHLHIPLQAGNDQVLQRMKRTYNTEFFGQLLERARALMPEAAICLDVITGFPGETDEEFESAFDFISSLPLTDLHVFPYSKRPGTPAANSPDQIPGNVSKARAERLRQLAAEKYRSFATSFIDKELEIVVESGEKDGLLKGVSRNYLDIRFSGDDALAVFGWGDAQIIKPGRPLVIEVSFYPDTVRLTAC